MNNLQEMKAELKEFIEQKVNVDIRLIWNTDKHSSLFFSQQYKNYFIMIKGILIYKSKDLELALKEYWKLIGEEYE